MKLLIVTQKVDEKDSNLGFFCGWLKEFSKRTDLIVVANEVGEYNLPENVSVYSLGKENKKTQLQKFLIYQKLLFKFLPEVDGIFFHMCPEYVIAAGPWPLIFGRKTALWYTHKMVDLKLKFVEKLVDKIFSASKESFRLPSKKLEITGHGIPPMPLNYNSIKEHEHLSHKDNLDLLSVGRISPSKDWETVIKAAAELQKRKIVGLRTIFCFFVGDVRDKRDEEYRDKLLQLGDGFQGVGVTFNHYPPEQMSNVYQNSHILIHTSRTGSMDKVVLENLAVGHVVVTSSEAYGDLAKDGLGGAMYGFPAGNYLALADKIEEIYKSGILEQIPIQKAIDYVRKNNDLGSLIGKIINFYA